ncbi:regulating synaptic membrane exocytosis protein 2 isoform X1 [Lates japonicus]
MSSRRGRQLPQLPPTGKDRKDGDDGTEPCEEDTDSPSWTNSGMDMEERTRQMKLKMNKYKQGAGSDSRLEQDYHKRSGRDPRGSDNLSAKSSDSDVSDVSAVSRTSSASRFSSTSYMSVQSERPQGNRKIRQLRSRSQSREWLLSSSNY